MVKESTVGRCSCSETNRDNLMACSRKGACDKGKVHERLMLFGIRIDGGGGGGGDGDEREMMRKSFSMGNLMACADPSSGDHGYLSDGLVHSSSNRKRPERKRGVPWTEEEHRTFLAGLEKLGKGDWRGISRKFVTTRTPTQVASHAQKYFLRQASHKKKRRSSLFDLVTTDVGGSSIDMNDKPVSVITNALAHLPLAMDSDISDPKKMLEGSCFPSEVSLPTLSFISVGESVEQISPVCRTRTHHESSGFISNHPQPSLNLLPPPCLEMESVDPHPGILPTLSSSPSAAGDADLELRIAPPQPIGSNKFSSSEYKPFDVIRVV